jgi:uncharacterized protein YdaU (DUF1376 family)
MKKQKSLPYYKMYPSDFMSKTARLTDEQVGAYIRLLNEQWLTGDIPPVIAGDVAGALRMICESAERSWGAISKYFVKSSGGMKNPRLEKERIKAIDLYNKKVKAGSTKKAPAKADDVAPDGAGVPPPDDITYNLEPKTDITEAKAQNSGVLRVHEAFRLISTRKPSNHEIMQLTQLTHEHDIESIVTAIGVMGDKGWHSIDSLKKQLKGDMPTNRGKGKNKVDVYKNPGKDQYEDI